MLRAAVSLVAAFTLVWASPAFATRTVALDAGSAVHVFVVGTDGALYHAPPGGVFERLGNPPAGPLAIERVAVGRNKDGRLDVFARGSLDNALYHLVESTPGGGWEPWAVIGTALAGPPDVAANADGRLEVFARGHGNALWHTWQAVPNSNWQPWASLGGSLGGEPAAILAAFNALYVFVRGTDGAMKMTLQDTSQPGGWRPLGNLGGLVTSDPAPVANTDALRIEIFARGTDDAIHHMWQSTPGGGFGAWTQRAGNRFVGAPATTLDGAGRVHTFARGTDNALWQTNQITAGGGWTDWRRIGGVLSGDPAAIRDGNGRINVFAPVAGSEWVRIAQTGPGPTDWGNFSSLGNAAPPPPPPLPIINPGPVVTPPVTPATIPARRVNVSLNWAYKARKRSTIFGSLTVRGVPAGATVTATCAKGCKRKSITVKNARGTVSLKKFVAKRAKTGTLKVGTKIRVVVSAPNMIAAVKTLTVRANRAPSVATRCLPPGAPRDVAC